jgi:uncharacterized membrane protein YbhN (UPF0104 family)
VSAQVTEKSVELATILAFTIPLLWHGPFGYRPGVALALLFATLAAPIVCLLWRLRGSDRSESFASRAERGVLDFARAFLWSFAADGFELVLIYVCLLSLHIHGGWVASVAVLAAINVAIAIPAAPGNLGTFEAGAAFGLLVCGVPTDAALAFALLYRVIQWAPVTIAGGLVAWLRRQSRPTAPSHGTGDHGCDALV